jgi:hypothetical protein
MEDNLFTSPSKRNDDYEKVPLLHQGEDENRGGVQSTE